jgi:hypothetical protein
VPVGLCCRAAAAALLPERPIFSSSWTVEVLLRLTCEYNA